MGVGLFLTGFYAPRSSTQSAEDWLKDVAAWLETDEGEPLVHCFLGHNQDDHPALAGPICPLFDELRGLRRHIAEERGVPPYLIFSDASLRDMARLRPTTLEQFRDVKGVGDWKLETFGERFVSAVRRVGAG